VILCISPDPFSSRSVERNLLGRDGIRIKVQAENPMLEIPKNIRRLACSLSITLTILSIMPASGSCATKYSSDDETLRKATEVLRGILSRNNVAPHMLETADCVAVSVDGDHGMMSCRTGGNFTGPWSPPTRYVADAANVRSQYGMVLLVIALDSVVTRSQKGMTEVWNVVSHTHSAWGCDPFSRCGK
jgi:hypothetical protein